MRNEKGQFVKGNIPLTPRDKTTGRFIKNPTDKKQQDRYSTVSQEIDAFLKDLEVKK